jgi:hypothetical protein
MRNKAVQARRCPDFSLKMGENRRDDGSGRNRRAADTARRRDALLFDQLQRDGGAAALALVLTLGRFRIARLFRRRCIPQHRIAQRLQFRVCNVIEFDPKLKDGHGYQLRSFPMTAGDESPLALLKRCQNRMQSFF